MPTVLESVVPAGPSPSSRQSAASRIPWAWLVFGLAFFGLAAGADAAVQHGAPLWGLTLLCWALLQGLRIGPVSWFYAYMAVFFVLGCWFKVMVHHLVDYPYVEPVGNFNGSVAEWAEYYQFASLMAMALLVSRAVSWLVIGRSRTRPILQGRPVSAWAWLGLLLVAFVFYGINNVAAFFVTGVDAKVRLPFGLNAPLAFMALIGGALVVASLVDRDLRARARLSVGTAFVVLVFAAVASMSMASRAAVVMQGVPILLAAYYLQSRWGMHRISLKPVLLFAVAVAVVLVVVSLYRVRVFAGLSGGDSEMAAFFLIESASLVIDRWIGAEALMMAVAEPTRSFELFFRLLMENPAVGVDSIYQTLSGGKYGLLQGLTFLTLPGYFAVIGLTGQGLAIFGFTLLMMVLGLIYERVLATLLRQQTLPLALASAAVANALTQLSFPQLMLPFLFQMLVLCAALGAMSGSSPAAIRSQKS